jgi:hypothetical protein
MIENLIRKKIAKKEPLYAVKELAMDFGFSNERFTELLNETGIR